ncbi:protein GET4-like [Physcomitrium patens]|uniref:protein GET4-like n=1 Tax=Physcomitrium patens TaxID=3218 RepID=UPI003CCE1B11
MKASQHFVGGNQPETFAKVVVECMDKCYPGEADLVVARAVLLYLSLGNLRDVNRLWDSVRQRLSDSSQELPDTPLLHLIKFLLLTCGTCYALSVVSLRCGAGMCNSNLATLLAPKTICTAANFAAPCSTLK